MSGIVLNRTGEEAPRSLTSAVYRQLRHEILSCQLAPGQKLPISRLASRLEVSPAAIREALSRLTADGLAVARDQRGFVVSQVSLADLDDVTEARIDVETSALRRAMERGDEEWVAGIRHSWATLKGMRRPAPIEGSKDLDRWRAAHNDFHVALISACGSLWLRRFREILFEQSERYRRLARRSEGAQRDIAAEHRHIMEATLDRDAETAVSGLAAHYRSTALRIKQSFGKADLQDALDGRSATGTARDPLGGDLSGDGTRGQKRRVDGRQQEKARDTTPT